MFQATAYLSRTSLIIGGLKQLPRLRQLRNGAVFLYGAANPPSRRRGLASPESCFVILDSSALWERRLNLRFLLGQRDECFTGRAWARARMGMPTGNPTATPIAIPERRRSLLFGVCPANRMPRRRPASERDWFSSLHCGRRVEPSRWIKEERWEPFRE